MSGDNGRGGVEEVRLAMAWNGGVSLAIWMGGAAVELDTARRAHLGRQRDDGRERAIYHALTETFERRLVIDILAGASAGGINGALLGAAITKRRELRPSFLRDRWLELGDLSSLLRPVSEAKPESLMRGDYFREQVRHVFRAVTGEGGDPEWLELTEARQQGELADEVLLDVQTTNVLGMQRAFSDQWHQTLYAREYRAPLRFRHADDYTSDALTAAARASASFPAAFEPSPLMSKSARLGGFAGVKRWAIDGGLLENAPIRPAIELIPTRRAERPVARFVCYVNAAPSPPQEDPDDPPSPKLPAVLSDIINLPREGRFVDQLLAIEDATQRTSSAMDVASGLLGLGQPHLRATAAALLDAYRKPRTTQSLRELMADSVDGGKVAARVAAVESRLGRTRLPWIPETLDPPTQASEWRWGLRGAQRVILLQLDLLRAAADQDDPEVDEATRAVERRRKADELLCFRRPLNKALARLEDARARFASSTAIRDAALALAAAAEARPEVFEERLDELDSLMIGFRCEAFDAVRRGTRTLYEAVSQGHLPPGVAASELFGDSVGGDFTDAHLQSFLERALCIEVVRRAFAPDRDLEPAQELRFIQLTPLAPVRVFADEPLRNEGPNSGREKLTGLDLAHFSAFYRRSWRANDFMWGRLDGATRVVDLFVSASRLLHLTGADDDALDTRLSALVTELVPEGDAVEARDRRTLVKEALDDAQRPAPELAAGVVAVAATGPVAADDVTKLRALLQKAIVADVKAADKAGFFTRVVCARAAQYEILCEELEPLALATAEDGKLGCFTEPIRHDAQSGALKVARTLVQPLDTLPSKLGSRVADESTSTLAVRTLSHAALVLISSLKTAGVPLAGTFGLLRAPFLSLAGITAQKARYRAAALLAFMAASFYVTARAVTAEDAPADLNSVWDLSTIATLVAVFGVLSLVGLPLWRARRATRWPRRIRQGFWGTGMLLTSGLAALIAAFFAVGFGNALTSTNGFTLSGRLAGAVIAVPLGAAAVLRYVRLPTLVSGRLGKLAARTIVTALATVAVGLLLIRATLPTLRAEVGIGEALTGAFDRGNWGSMVGLLDSPSQLWDACKDRWREIAVVAAYASVPLAGLYGMHGFIRRAVDVSRVSGPELVPSALRWLRDKPRRGQPDEPEEPPATMPTP